MRIGFEGRVALVTGATRGIGKQIAEDLGRQGAELILTGTNPEEIAATVSFLADPAIGSLVGQVVQVNGGTTRGRV